MSSFENIREVTLAEILDARERRYMRQRELMHEFKAALISFTMNIPGPVKNSPAIERAFWYGYNELLAILSQNNILFTSTNVDYCGCSAFICVDADPRSIKELCVGIEEANQLGRLFDMDVIDNTGIKLERKQQRACMMCGKPGRECSAGRVHSAEELMLKTTDIITEHFTTSDSKKIGKLAVDCLIREVETTPKPGLVDLNNSGSHSDMDADTFRKSALSLESYFTDCVNIGIQSKNEPHGKAFRLLREAGLKAEKTMYDATGGVNTHKGLIYSLGVLLGAVGRNWLPHQPISCLNSILSDAGALVTESSATDLASASGATAGETLFLQYGLKGIRGEVKSGFSSVTKHSLPAYKAMKKNGFSDNDAGVYALLSLIASVDDTNLYRRGGIEGAGYAKECAERMLAAAFDRNMVVQMDAEFIRRRLSPGGSADLLAITYFIDSLEKPFL